MGIGKTKWVLWTLSKYYADKDQKILMVFPRVPVRHAVDSDIKWEGIKNIDVMSYQHINDELRDEDTRKAIQAELAQYACIICDEFHYWIHDSAFTDYTEYSYEQIIKRSPAQKVLLSATPEDILAYMQAVDLAYTEYRFDNVYKVANSISFFQEDATLDALIQDSINNNIKTIVFVQKASEGLDLYLRYKDHCQFVTSRKDYDKYRDKKAEWYLEHHERFKSLILITTLKLEEGVTIKDKYLKRIIVKAFDPVDVKQCLGRKRQNNETDKADIFIYEYDGKSVNGKRKTCQDNLNAVSNFLANKNNYIDKNGRDSKNFNAGGIIINYINDEGQIDAKRNYHKHFYNVCLLHRIREMLERGYAKKLLDYINPDDSTKIFDSYEDVLLTDKLLRLLNEDGYCDFVTEDDKDTLRNLIDYKKNGVQMKQIKTLNERLKNLESGLIIERFSFDRNHKYAWKLKQLD